MHIRPLAYVAVAFFSLHSLLHARPVDPSRATKLAYDFLQSVQPQGGRNLGILKGEETPAFYVYNREEGAGGFVLVSKDDSRGAILGYSTQGRFVLDSLPEGLRTIFLSWMPASSSAQEARRIDFPQPMKKPITPLLKSKWGQIGYQYNSLTPLFNGSHSPSGCVATAVAQIMYYHQWPLRGKGSHKHFNPQIGTVDFSKHTYHWDQMLPVYGRSELYQRNGYPYPEDAPRFTSVSRLMYDVGVAVNMNYTPSSSGAYSEQVPKAMQDYFDYEASKILTKSLLGEDALEAFVEQELRAGFPLYISGENRRGGAGHAWVIDGMDAQGFFHMNFGWDGVSDGFYSLRVINPSQLGPEFQGKGRPTFSSNLQLIALHPKKAGSMPLDTEHELLRPRLRANLGCYIHLVSERRDGLVVEMSDVVNRTGKSFTGDYGYGLYDDAGLLLRVYPSKYHPKGGYHTLPEDGLINTKEQDLLPIQGLADGVYSLRLMSSERQGEQTWMPWFPMQETPSLEFELNRGKITVLQESSVDGGLQPMAQPLHGHITAGKQVQIGLLLKNLTGIDPDLSLSLHLLDTSGKRISSTTTASPVTFRPLGTELVYFQLSIPAGLPAGKYQVELEAMRFDEKVAIQKYKLREDLFIEVHEPVAGSLEVLQASALTDPVTALGAYTLLDLEQTPNLRLRLQLLRPATDETKLDEVRISLVDVYTGSKILCGISRVSDLAHSDQPAQLQTVPLKGSLAEQLTLGHVYRLAVEGIRSGKTYDLWPTVLRQAYLGFLGVSATPKGGDPRIIQALDPAQVKPEEEPKKPEEEKKPEITPVDEASAFAPIWQYFPGEARLRVQGEGLRLAEVFSLSGKLLQTQALLGALETEFSLGSLPSGIYLIRLVGASGSRTIRVRR